MFCSCSHWSIALENFIPKVPAKSDPGRCASQFGSKRPRQLASTCGSRPCHQTLKAATWSPSSSSSGTSAWSRKFKICMWSLCNCCRIPHILWCSSTSFCLLSRKSLPRRNCAAPASLSARSFHSAVHASTGSSSFHPSLWAAMCWTRSTPARFCTSHWISVQIKDPHLRHLEYLLHLEEVGIVPM